jgi:Tfp pilus assembly protein PilO
MRIKLSFRETIITFTTLLVTLYFLFDYFLYSPKQKEYQALQQEFSSVSQKIQEALVFFSSQRNIAEEIRGLESKLTLYEEKFSKKEQFDKFLEQLAVQCRQLNMNLLTLQPKEEKVFPAQAGHGQYRQISIDMELQCDYRAAVLYIQALEQLPVFVTVDHLELRRDEQSPGIIFHVVLKTLFA